MARQYIGMSTYGDPALQYAKSKAPDKYLIETEACVDSEVPAWKDDAWYWSRATDWGWDWASAEDKCPPQVCSRLSICTRYYRLFK